MLRRVDRIMYRVPQLQSAVAYYRDVLGMKLLRQTAHLATFALEGGAELVLHADEELPAEATYFLVDDVRDLYERRDELKLRFSGPPVPVSKGYRAAARDPFGNVLLLIDRSAEHDEHAVEDAKPVGALFAGVETKSPIESESLIRIYSRIGRTADDLPYTPHFETLYSSYIEQFPDPKPTRREVWRHLLTLRKNGNLPRLGAAKSHAPDADDDARQRLLEMLGDDLGKRDRLPYTERFDQIVDEFNKTLPQRLSPHLVWRLVATLAK